MCCWRLLSLVQVFSPLSSFYWIWNLVLSDVVTSLLNLQSFKCLVAGLPLTPTKHWRAFDHFCIPALTHEAMLIKRINYLWMWISRVTCSWASQWEKFIIDNVPMKTQDFLTEGARMRLDFSLRPVYLVASRFLFYLKNHSCCTGLTVSSKNTSIGLLVCFRNFLFRVISFRIASVYCSHAVNLTTGKNFSYTTLFKYSQSSKLLWNNKGLTFQFKTESKKPEWITIKGSET